MAQRLIGFAVATAVGGFVLLAAFRVIPGEFYAPPWVVALCGCMFLVGGVLVLTVNGGNKFEPVKAVANCAVVYLFAAVANWVAFSSGRAAELTAELVPYAPQEAPRDLLARLPFGLSAVFLDVLAVVMTVNGARALIARLRLRQR